MKQGRHGTQAVAINNSIIIGAGSGNRGGGPELTSFEIFSSEENPEVTAEPLEKGELTVSLDTLNFSQQSQQIFTLKNNSSNKAMLISYIQTNPSEKFKIKSDNKSPFIIPPGKTIEVKIEVARDLPKNLSGTLFIKPAGQSAPLEISLKNP